MMRLLFSGTSDGTEVAKLLFDLDLDVTISVVTDYGRLLASKFGQPVIQGRMTQDDMVQYIQDNHITEVIDASHPFADIVSKEAIQAAKRAGVPYVRYERASTLDLSGAIVVHSTQEAIEKIKPLGEVVYLGTGSKTLPLFVEGLPDKHIVVRVLPVSDVVKQCEDLGLVANQIHAIQAPFTKEMNNALMQKAKANVFVSKEGGDVSGIREKIDGCLELGIDCVIITRPKVEYPIMFSTIEDLRNYLLQTN
ncbi:precorrin-6A reductase [Granulicatella sp. 19428wC4_WM01]|uniref:precorrin-6A reductase n=1 Tax=unclassified Granulicatella TaxID=2630493 RepID=UPI00107394BF|nr:precorrin-6A reductase [Granulicatella sp. 19428wC4_WM01]TFU96485.1 precorrin-6A reductase [Granulicatella sp. WM01]